MGTDIKSYLRVIFSRLVLKHLIAAVVALIVLATLLLFLMRFYTHHGEVVVVPNVQGLTVSQAIPLMEERSLKCQVVDSVYNEHARPGNIINQTPSTNGKVKKGRTIYVTVNTYNKPKVTVPDVTQTSERSARATLEALGLKVIRTELQPSEYRDLVLDMKTLDGERLTPGSQMEVGSGVVLVVSTADDPNEEVIVTDDEVTVKPQPTLQPHNHDIEEFF